MAAAALRGHFLVGKLVNLTLILMTLFRTSTSEYLQEFEISEGVGLGTTIGLIGQSTPGQSKPPPPPYLIVPVPGSAVDSDLHIDQSTGEIRTSVLLDREERSYYSFVAIPPSGENIRVVIKVEDENDNAPEFPTPFMAIEFPENTPRDVKRTLNPARDKDLGVFNTQRYKIVSGNVNNAFRLSSHRERDDVLYLDLQINGFLDRETTFFYSLVIEAYDGGTPPMKGSMTVNITIQDVNDNQPIFNQSRYFATVAENATIGTSVLKVFATDTDSGDNGRISYSINRRQSDRENVFAIDAKTGVISVNKLLDFEAKDVHELVIVARDNGAQPLETTAFVSIRVTDVNDNQPTINLIFLSDDASPKISEDAKPGEFVARISVNDPDSKEEYANVNVTLQGGDGHFGLTTQDNIIYLVIVSHPLDREEKPNYTMVVTATDQGSPPLNASRAFELSVTDTNDNAPEFDHTVYYANVLEVADPGTSVFQLSAVDRDEGNNSVVTYAIKDTPETHSEWFVIDTKTGLVTTRMHIDCETDPIPQITVVATDGGNPPLSSSATVVVTISDVNDNEPIFDQSFYNVTISENEAVGKCVIRVSATDPDCGVNAMVNYTMGGGRGTPFSKDFTIQPLSGELCIASELDHERRTSYEIPVQATDRGGLSTTAMIKVQVIDANDNVPIFYPREYNVSLKEGVTSSNAVIVVVATDEDSGLYGTITYSIVSGNDEGLFRIDLHTGEIFVARRLISNVALHHLMISAEDGGGLTSESAARVYISILTSNQQPPIFEKARYRFSVREDVPPQTVVGTVTASSSDPGSGNVRYAIYSGDPNGYFSIHPSTGTIMTRNNLDHESHPYLLLNVQAISGNPPSYGHSQVNITIWDVNDNAPEFASVSLKISVAENTELQVPIYVVHAEDPDTGRNGAIVYELLENPVKKFSIDDKTGAITLREKLDYENQQSYQLLVNARDGGVPVQSSNLTLFVEVQDINDNPPVFDLPEYRVEISESTIVNTQFLQVTATDKDTGNNARLTYKITASDHPNIFGVFPNSGVFYLKETLDRETLDRYVLSITAMDNGTPHLSATTSVVIRVLDDNDNDPKFTEELFEFQVEENKEKGFKIGSLAAFDKDAGNNGSLRYSLLQKQNNGSFSINAVTGDILTLGGLDRERTPVIKLSAVVHDQGSPPRSHTTSVQVTLIDVNDNAPIFVEPSEVSVMVKEEQPVGTEVVQAQAMDNDKGKNAQISYAILPTNDTDGSDGSAVFLINSITGMITTKKMLDREQQQLYTLIIQANDGGTPTLTAMLRLQVQVLDVNDNQPAFPTSSLSFRLKEGVPIGHQVGVVQAIDRDNGDNGYVTYSITGGNTYGLFDIGRTTGVVFTIAEVDYETASEHVLQVEAVDSSATNPQSNVVNVKIEIEDLNDCTPSFKTDPVIFSISESIPVDSVVWNFTAVDQDSGPNGQIIYRISQQSPAEAFSVEEKSGILRVSRPVDYETFPEYTIVVTASDQAPEEEDRLEASVTCRVIIEDENDNGPAFKSRTTINVIEDEPVGFPLLHVIAVDEDSRDNGRVTYVINKGNEKGHFALDYDSGLLSIARSLDREDTHHYVLNITASDHGKPTQSAYQLIHIYVEDVNDNPPHFEQAIYKASLSEAAQIGTFVTKVRANDKDVGASGNLTYVIPNGVADNRFTISARTGEIRTAGPLDREEKSSYIITVYVRDGAFPAHYDTSTVVVDLLDVNDHAPDFGDSCYPLHVPENSELGIIHTVVATDHDTGPNSEITYTITDGNVGSKFSIDLHTGHLSSRPLDREQLAQYQLTITARDLGDPSLVGVCNITVTVLDQNDNDPFFERNEYSVSLPEDTPVNTTVLLVQAHDRDDGINSKITYSLNNETQSLFRIDSDTGAITTAGHFDREKRSFYMFEVRATDGGPYDARSERALISITITDVNDNKPVFAHYPFVASVSGHAPPGTQVTQLSAEDSDEGANSAVYFSFPNFPLGSKFHLEPSTGVVTVAGSLLADVGKVFHIDIVARDKGEPSKSSTGVLEITVGENINVSNLQFDNSTYQVEIPEHPFNGVEVLQVRAHSPGNTAQVITYNLGGESEENLFDINSQTGMIFVKNPDKLDYETSPLVTITVVAQARNSPNPSYGYASVIVNVQDKNDNAPRFSQEKYVSSVWEGNNKGTFVTQVTAMDDDQDGVGNILYHVIEGNHDNAFVIDPPFSGIVKTNIVLDREIREAYTLTIIAVDDGTPQMTGTCTLKISIVDVNDNQPVFPPHSYVSISEGAEVGTVVTTITANDVDTNPTLTYSFTHAGNPGGHFSIDRYSGRITLAQPLDHEIQDNFELQIQASDSAHVAETLLTVHVTDINDNPPVFSQQSYQVTLPELVDPGYAVATVNATDKDSDENAAIFYSMSIAPVDGFYIDSNTGVIFTNASVEYDPKRPIIQLVVTARDKGKPSLASVAAVGIQVVDVNNNPPRFTENKYVAHLSEDAPRGSTVIKVSAMDHDESRRNNNIDYSIVSGNVAEAFIITGVTGEIILIKELDREQTAIYNITVLAMDRGSPTLNSTTEVTLYVDDINDHPPLFSKTLYESSVSESAIVGATVLQVAATDMDKNQKAKITYDITSGNGEGRFSIDTETGVLVIDKLLDYEETAEYKFIVRATDNDPQRPLSALSTVVVRVEDENDNSPHFPLQMYTEFVEENAPIGTTVFNAHAIDADRGIYGKVNYSLTEGEGTDKFRIDTETGMVTTAVVFDYESKARYFFTLMAVDLGNKYATVQVQVDIEGRDEYPPEFTRNNYHFVVPADAPVGMVAGKVQALDKDEGPDGRVLYHLKNNEVGFGINATTGAIVVTSPLKKEYSKRRKKRETQDVNLYVIASSGRPTSLTSMSVVGITVDYNLNASIINSIPDEKLSASLPAWGLGLMITLAILAIVLLSLVFLLRLRTKRNAKPPVIQGFDNSFDTIDIRHPPSSSGSLSQFPPHYNDISQFDPTESTRNMNGATSEVSDQSHSASSGRGSAEDGEDVEDEEIRMINEGPLLQQQKLHSLGLTEQDIHHDDDDLSDISVQNTQEYLARLGINPNTQIEAPRKQTDFRKHPCAQSVESMRMFDEEGGGEGDGMDISNLIYSKLDEVGDEDNDAIMDGTRAFGFGEEGEPSMTGSLSSIVHSEEELTGSYNWDYLLDWGPQYQPLAHVFAEIARLKDDSLPSTYIAGPLKKMLNPQVKTLPPPLITNVAPRSIAPVALSSGHPSQVPSLPSLPRSPISHDSTFSSPAMSPSFTPSLSPLATRSPSISPMVTPGSGLLGPGAVLGTPHHGRPQRGNVHAAAGSSGSETELHI